MNPITPTHEITLGGVTRQLRYQHRDFATAEYLLKRQGWDISLLGPKAAGFWKDVSEEVENPDQDKKEPLAAFDQFKVGVLLFAGLVHADKKLTLESVQDLVTFVNASEVSAVVMAAVAEALAPLIERDQQKPPEGGEERPLPPASGGDSAGHLLESTLASMTENSGG